jgi:hypothetical protein
MTTIRRMNTGRGWQKIQIHALKIPKMINWKVEDQCVIKKASDIRNNPNRKMRNRLGKHLFLQ